MSADGFFAKSSSISDQLIAIASSYFGLLPKIYYRKFWINCPSNKPPSQSQLWHRDGDGSVLKVFVYLEDVTEENGPFNYLRNSHRGRQRFVNPSYRNQSQSTDPD